MKSMLNCYDICFSRINFLKNSVFGLIKRLYGFCNANFMLSETYALSENPALIADSIFSSCSIENVCGIHILIFTMIVEAARQSCLADELKSFALFSSSVIRVTISVNCFVFKPKSSRSQL